MIMRIFIIAVIFSYWDILLKAEDTVTVKGLLSSIDANLYAESQIYTSTMVVHGRRSSRTIKSKSWVIGMDQAFMEYLSPPREAGTKMLKKGNKL